jgi:transcriptional regulator with XRE-family HTH domain
MPANPLLTLNDGGPGMDILVLVGNRIRQLRKEARLTQSDLADKAGLSTNFIALLEKGKRSASIDTLFRIAQVLRIDMRTMFDFPENKTKSQLIGERLQKLLNRRSVEEIELIEAIAGLILQRKPSKRR